MRKHLKFLWVLGVLFVGACGTSDDDAAGGGSSSNSPLRISSYSSTDKASAAYTYNEQGQRTMTQGVYSDGVTYTDEFTYTEDGKLQRKETLEIEIYQDEESSYRKAIDYSYNSVGQRINAVKSSPDHKGEWVAYSTSVYTYDDQGRLIQKTEEDEEDITKYVYNDAGQLAFVIDEYVHYNYDPEKDVETTSTVTTTKTYTYNSAGQLAKTEDLAGEDGNFVLTFTYDDEGKLIEYVMVHTRGEKKTEATTMLTYEEASCTYLNDKYDPEAVVFENATCRE